MLTARERDIYLERLDRDILPFWLNNSIDRVHGGIFTCFENATAKLISTDKYTWSQGRAVWMFSALAAQPHRSGTQRAGFLDIARAGAEFLMRNCLLPNGNCSFVLTREGSPKPQSPGAPLDSSIYADCFVIYGLARFAVQTGERAPYDFAAELYRSVLARVASGNFRSAPYPVPPRYRMHGISMIVLMISEEMRAAARTFDPDFEPSVAVAQKSACADIMGIFTREDDVLHEMIGDGGCTLFDRFTNPGHTIECMWIVMHYALSEGDAGLVRRAAAQIKGAFARGWDAEFGGLTLYADQAGGPPAGEAGAYADDPMAIKVMNDWSGKLWWVHSEALYSTLLAEKVSGDADFGALYRKSEDYAFATFPNPDRSIGEWIQIRDRQGRPESKVVALPVKDPFHIVRNFIQISQL